MSHITQKEMVLNHIKKNGKITTMDAFALGITRLSARIWDLKRDGVSIVTQRVNYKTKDGVSKHYDLYMLGSQS